MRLGLWGEPRRVLAAITVVVVLAGCTDDQTGGAGDAPRKTTLRVGLFPAANTLPVHAALTRGIFERHGLDVVLTEGQDLPLFMAAQAKGQYDIAMSTPTLVLVAAQKGLGLQVVSSTAQQTAQRPNAVWITTDPSIRSLADLRGGTLAVPSLTGIITDAVVYLLQRKGLQRNEVRLIQTPFPAMGDQLEAGHVNAAVATLPYSTAIVARGFLAHEDVIVEAVDAASGGAVAEAITTVWTVPRQFALDNPAAMTAWRDALREAVDALESDQNAARAMMADWLGIPSEILDEAPLPDWTVDITPRQLEPYVAIARQVGTIDSDPDTTTLVWQGP